MGYQFHYRVQGHWELPVVLFLHGFMGSSADFATPIAQLADQFCCLAIDLPGHGQTIVDGEATLYTMPQTAQAIGTGVYTLKKHFPDLCRSISKRYASYLSECCAQRIQVIREEIRQVATNLDNQGIEPTASRVSPYLKKPRSILQKEAKVALKEVRYELGWGK